MKPIDSSSERNVRLVIERVYDAKLDEVWELWTTKAGFESWWGPEGFRADVHLLEAQPGGALRYDMVADSPEMVAAMASMGQPASHPVKARFTELQPRTRLVISSLIDFLPGVESYESDIEVDLAVVTGGVRMRVTLHGMHNRDFTAMQREGFTSQLSKLDRRYGWSA